MSIFDIIFGTLFGIILGIILAALSGVIFGTFFGYPKGGFINQGWGFNKTTKRVKNYEPIRQLS